MIRILLTGPPGIGKSTAIERILEMKDSNTFSGIRTAEVVDEKGKRVGFKTISYPSLKERTIAHKTCIDSNISIGSYKVKIQAINDSLTEGLLTRNEITLIDEIGRMQALSDLFITKTKELFDQKTTSSILGTIVYDDELFARYFKKKKDVLVIRVSEENRGQLPGFIGMLLWRTQKFSYQEWYRFVQKADRHIKLNRFSSALHITELV